MINNSIQYPYPDEPAQEIEASATLEYVNTPKKRASILSFNVDLPPAVTLKIVIDGRENAFFFSKGNESGVLEFPDGVPYRTLKTTVVNGNATAQDFHVRYVIRHDTQ